MMRSGAESGKSPVILSVSRLCEWAGIRGSTRDHWVEKGFVRYLGDSNPDQAAVVETFLATTLHDALGLDEAHMAWTRTKAEVFNALDDVPLRLDLVWIASPPAAQLVRTTEELLQTVLSAPRRLAVVRLAPRIREAVSALNMYEQAAWATETAEREKARRIESRPKRALRNVPK